MPLSTSRLPTIFSLFFSAVAAVFGVINIFYPLTGLTFFEIPPPRTAEGQQILHVLMKALGIRDIFIFACVSATAAYGSHRAMGWILVAAGACAGVDGWACRLHVGAGQWNHWNYAPMLVVLGLVKLGLLG